MSAVRRTIERKLEQALGQQLAPLRARYEALQPREQWLVATAGIVIALALVYAAVWKPVAQARLHRATELEAARAVASSLVIAEAEVLARGQRGGAVVGGDVSLLSAVDQASKSGTLNKAPSRLQPDGDNQVRVWLEDVQFEALLRWMYELQSRYGLRIDVADVERQPTPGLVNARLSLMRAQ